MIVKFLKFFGFFSFFILSLFLFIYWTFPYQLIGLKISDLVYQEIGLNLEIKKISPFFVTQIDMNNIKISHNNQPSQILELEQVSIDISTIGLLMGNLNIDITIKQKKGKLSLKIKSNLSFKKTPNSSSPISIGNINTIQFNSDNFNLEALSDLGLVYLKKEIMSDPITGAMLEPLLKGVRAQGNLNSKIDLSLSPQFDKSQGQLELTFNQLSLEIANEDLGIPKQDFSKAHLSFKTENGTIKWSDDSILQGTDISIKPSGKLIMKPTISSSMLDLNLAIKLEGKIKSSLELLLTTLLGLKQATDGTINQKISGTLTRPQF